MSFSAPLFLGALALLGPTLLAFLVRRRRRSVKVPSTLLWRRVAVARSRNRRFRFFTRVLALIACLCAIAALAVAAARPHGLATGATVALVVDGSASMEGAPMDEARAMVARYLDSRGATDRYVILVAGDEVRHVAGPTDDSTVLAAAQDQIAAGHGEADLGAAVDLGAELVRGWSGAEVILLTDGGASSGDSPHHVEGVPITYHLVGDGRRDNLGITSFASRPPSDALDVAEREVIVAVASSSEDDRTCEVALEAGGVTIARERLLVPAGREGELRLRVHLGAGRLRATVVPLDGRDDALAADDWAELSAPVVAPPRVLLVADGGDPATVFFVRRALEAARVGAVVEASAGDAWASEGDVDVAIVLGPGTERTLGVPTLFFATRGGALPFGDAPRALAEEELQLRAVDERDAMLRGVALDGVTIRGALAVVVPDDAIGLVELDGGTVMARGGAGAGRWVYLGVDPRESDLVLRVAFPVMLANALAQLRGSEAVAVAHTAPLGEVALARGALGVAVQTSAAPGIALPVSAPVWLVGIAAVLLLAELAVWRKGWA